MNNASSTGAMRFNSVGGAKGPSTSDASATSQIGIPAQETSATERASLRSTDILPLKNDGESVSPDGAGFSKQAVLCVRWSAFGDR
jgi:hypothetical protein